MTDTADDIGPEIPIGLSGAIGRRMTVVNASQTRLLTTFGALDGDSDEQVLMGLTDFSLQTSSALSQAAPQEPIELTLTVENMAFLLSDMSRDFAGVCEGLARLSSDAAPMEPTRLKLMQSFLADVLKEISRAQEALQKVTTLRVP